MATLPECVTPPTTVCLLVLWCRRRVKSSRRQLQLQQFAEQQQQLAAERTAKWGQGLLQRLRQGLGFHRPWQSTVGSSSSSSSEPSAAAADSGSSAGDAATMQGPQHQQLPLQQQQQKPGGLNLLLHGLWPAGASTTAAAAAGSSPAAGGQGLLPAPPMSQPGSTPGQPVTSHEEPKRPSGADWGVTDAALSLRSLLGSSLGGLGSSSSGPTSTATAPAAAPGADAAARPLDVPSSSSSKGSKGQLSAQQQQLRNILSTVVPFDAVSLTGSNPGLTWSAQQGLGVLKEAAGRLYNELAVGSFSGGLKVEIQGRLKSLRSVHNKMERKSCSVEVRMRVVGAGAATAVLPVLLRGGRGGLFTRSQELLFWPRAQLQRLLLPPCSAAYASRETKSTRSQRLVLRATRRKRTSCTHRLCPHVPCACVCLRVPAPLMLVCDTGGL